MLKGCAPVVVAAWYDLVAFVVGQREEHTYTVAFGDILGIFCANFIPANLFDFFGIGVDVFSPIVLLRKAYQKLLRKE